MILPCQVFHTLHVMTGEIIVCNNITVSVLLVILLLCDYVISVEDLRGVPPGLSRLLDNLPRSKWVLVISGLILN